MPPPPVYSPPPPPPTNLGRYRTLSPLAGVRVSPMQLGAMSIGDKWQEFGMGSMDKISSFKLFDAYFDAGVSRSLHATLYTQSRFLPLIPGVTSSTRPTRSKLPLYFIMLT
jgi:hypothetical protein